jgi:hypothetical protein
MNMVSPAMPGHLGSQDQSPLAGHDGRAQPSLDPLPAPASFRDQARPLIREDQRAASQADRRRSWVIHDHGRSRGSSATQSRAWLGLTDPAAAEDSAEPGLAAEVQLASGGVWPFVQRTLFQVPPTSTASVLLSITLLVLKSGTDETARCVQKPDATHSRGP